MWLSLIYLLGKPQSTRSEYVVPGPVRSKPVGCLKHTPIQDGRSVGRSGNPVRTGPDRVGLLSWSSLVCAGRSVRRSVCSD